MSFLLVSGDCVGMSTVPEVVAGHHCNMQVLCLSLVTNKVIMEGDEGQPVATHAEVLEAVGKRSVQMQKLVAHIVEKLDEGFLHNLEMLPPVNLDGARLEYQRQQTIEEEMKNGARRISFETLAAGAIMIAAGSFLSSYVRRAN